MERQGERGGRRTDLPVALETVQPPPDKGLASLWWLVVLEQRARSVRILDRVRRCGEQARRGKVGLPLVLGCRRRGARFRARLVGIAVAGVGTGARKRTGTSRRRRAAPWRIPALVLVTVTALMALASICMLYGGAAPFPSRASENGGPGSRPNRVGSRTGRPCPHPSSVCDHIDRRSRLFFYFPICDSHRHSRPLFVCRRRNKPVSACPAPGLLAAGLWARAQFRVCAASVATWVVATTATGVSVGVAVLFK